MKYINIIIAGFLLIPFVACDDFLKVHPKGEILERDLFTNAQGFEDAIYGVYGSLQSTSLYGKDLLWGIPDVLSQDLESGDDATEALSKYDYKNNKDLKSEILSVWTSAYQTIGYANNILEQLKKWSPETLPLYNHYKGEMLGVRALLHFDMLRMFAPTNENAQGIPYVTQYSYKVKPFYKVGEDYQFIIADLKEAEELMADEENTIVFPHNDNNYNKFENYQETHFNLYAVRALLARVYWMKGDMVNAAVYAEKVIDSGKFPLVGETEVKDYLAGVLSPKETIFGVYSNTYVNTAKSYLYEYMSYHSFNPYYDGSGKTHLMPYTAVYAKDIDNTVQDYRLNQFVAQTGYVKWLKLTDYYTIEERVPENRQNMIPGITLLHTSEMYLIASEALLDTDYDKALAYFDAEIQSRGLTPLAQRGIRLTKDIIYNEYHKELFGEGQVWYNMKRLKKDIISNKETKVIPASDNVYVLPIPEEEFNYRN